MSEIGAWIWLLSFSRSVIKAMKREGITSTLFQKCILVHVAHLVIHAKAESVHSRRHGPAPAQAPFMPLTNSSFSDLGTLGSLNLAKTLPASSIVLGALAASLFFLGLLIPCLISVKQRASRYRGSKSNACSASNKTLTEFSLETLEKATGGFSHRIGAGIFGSVYKGILEDGTEVAVKKIELGFQKGEKEFRQAMVLLSEMDTNYFVSLYGFCAQRNTRMLVLEYFPKGSLDRLLFDTPSSLNWELRHKIAIAVARALAFTHGHHGIHGNLKPENVVLDLDLCPKLTDSCLIYDYVATNRQDIIQGLSGNSCRGYLSPEWIANAATTSKVDVYAFGIMLLEMVAGRRSIDLSFPDPKEWNLVSWAFGLCKQGNFVQILEAGLRESADEMEVCATMSAAFWCVQEEQSMRPTMDKVVDLLLGKVEFPFPPYPRDSGQVLPTS